MIHASYARQLANETAAGWHRFWFHPSPIGRLDILRFASGLAALSWQLSFTPDLSIWLNTNGYVSLETVRQWMAGMPPDVSKLSLFTWFSSTAAVWSLHGLSSLILIAYTLGCGMRLLSWAALTVVLTYVHRTPLIDGPSEVVLTMMLLYLPIAAWPAGWAPTRRPWRVADPVAPSIRNTVARRLLQVHVTILYVAIGLTQLAATTWWQGEAIWWLSAQPGSRLVDLTFLRDHPYLLNLWTHTVSVSILAFAVLVWVRLLRPLLLAWIIIVWLSIAIASGWVPFATVMILASMSFLPEQEVTEA